MLPQVSCELVQSMVIWVLLMPFPQTLCCLLHFPLAHAVSCWRASPSTQGDPAQGAVPSWTWQPFQAGLRPRDKLFGSLAISRCEIPVTRGQVGGEEPHLRAFFLYNNFVFFWALRLLMGTAGQVSCIPGHAKELWDELEQEQDHNHFLALRLFLLCCYWCKSTELHGSQQYCFGGWKHE